MRLHVTFFYVLMLLLSYNVSVNITCNGQVQKRAIDFDSIADFADIIEPEPEPVKHFVDLDTSLQAIRNLDVDLPGLMQTQTVSVSDTRNADAATASSTTRANSNADMDKILNFRMKQFKFLPHNTRRKRRVPMRKLRRRYVSLPVAAAARGGSYLAHLAEATNDIKLKMQNYAATMMVVITTPRSTSARALVPLIKTRFAEEGKQQEVPTSKTLNENIISESTSEAISNTRKSSMITQNLPTSEHYSRKFFTESSPPTEHTTKIKSKSTEQSSTNTVSHLDMDYPLSGTDDMDLKKISVKRKKRNSQNNFNDLLKVVFVKITPPILDIERTTLPLITTNPKSISSLSSHVSLETTRIMERTPNLCETTVPSTNSTSCTDQGKHSNVTPKYSTTTMMTKSNSYSITSTGVNPYRWENEMVKELNLKFKKEAENISSTTTGTPNQKNTTKLDDICNEDLPICNGKECNKFNQTFMIYNDSASDCNREPTEEGGQGGYDIISNEDVPTTEDNVKCAPHFSTTTTMTTTSKTISCEKMKNNPCDPDQEEDSDPCNMGELHKQDHCQKEKKQKLRQKKIKPTRNKRQAALALQTPSFIPNSEVRHAFSNYVYSPTSPNINSPSFNTYAVPFSATAVSAVPSNSIPALQVSPGPMLVPVMPPVVSNINEKIVKKSIDKNVLNTVIENLKIVDQKLADAVDPLHNAQDQLDAAARCNTTPSADQTNCNGNSEGNGGNLLSDLSDSEKAALQRLALKIMANPCPKLKRDENAFPVMPVDADSKDFLKRGVTKKSGLVLEGEATEEDTLHRVQRDISVAEGVADLIEKVKNRQHIIAKRDYFPVEKSSDEFGELKPDEFLSENDAAKLARSLDVINARVKASGEENPVEYHGGTKKIKPKKLWRKLFGFRGNQRNNRFLDQDIQNSQSKRKKNLDPVGR